MNYFVNIDISQQKKARPFTAEPPRTNPILMKRKLLIFYSLKKLVKNLPTEPIIKDVIAIP